MGRAKLLLPWNTEHGSPGTVLEAVLAAWRAAAVDERIVVTHADDVEVAELARRGGARVVTPSPPPVDMKASLLAGVQDVEARHHPRDNDLWLVAPADMPWLSPAVVAQLLAAARGHSAAVFKPTYQDRRGHPVALRWSLTRALATLPVDAGLNVLLAQHVAYEVPVEDPHILADLDTPEDYARERPPIS